MQLYKGSLNGCNSIAWAYAGKESTWSQWIGWKEECRWQTRNLHPNQSRWKVARRLHKAGILGKFEEVIISHRDWRTAFLFPSLNRFPCSLGRTRVERGSKGRIGGEAEFRSQYDCEPQPSGSCRQVLRSMELLNIPNAFRTTER